MDFSQWSPSHLIIAGITLAVIIGQGIFLFGQIKALIGQLDKRIDEVKTETNQRLSDMHAEIRDVRLELSKLNQNHINHLTHHERRES